MATTNIEAGAVIIDERPFVSVLSKSQRTKVSAQRTGTQSTLCEQALRLEVRQGKLPVCYLLPLPRSSLPPC